VTYPPYPLPLASNAPFRVYDDMVELGATAVDQRYAPSGPVFAGFTWESLGTFVIQSGVLRVELSDVDADNSVAADAVRIVPVRNNLEILVVDASPERSTIETQVSVTIP